MNARHFLAHAVLLALLSTVTAVSWGADCKDEKSQVRGLQQRMRALEQDKARLNQGKAESDGQLKEAREKLELAQRNAESSGRKKVAVAKELEESKAENELLQARLKEVESLLSASGARVAALESELSAVRGSLAGSELKARQLGTELEARSQSLGECVAKNEGLYRVGAQLIKESADRVGGALAGEPLTQLSRVALESRLEEHRERLDQQVLLEVRREEHEKATRRALQEGAGRERAERERTLVVTQEQERLQNTRQKQQSWLDRWGRDLRKRLDGFEW